MTTITIDYELQSMAANAIAHAANMVQASWQEAAGYYTLPHVVHRPKLSKDGDQWCALLGDSLQEGVAGFGDSPAEAMWDFDKQWFAKLPTIEGVPGKETDQKGQQ